jgi:hypothetical protein
MKKVTIILILFCIISCRSQEIKQDKVNTNKYTMERFDIKKYRENKGINGYEFVSKDNENIRQIEHEDKTFSENIKKNNSPYLIIKIFYLDGSLKMINKNFYNFQIEIKKEYDEVGKLIKEIDNDLPYKFSITDLQKKIIAEYQIDIIYDYLDSKSTEMTVNRWTGYDKDFDIYKKNVPMYQVHFSDKNNNDILLEINATTGATIKKMVNNVVEK